MKKDQCIKREGPEPLAAVLARLMAKVQPTTEPPAESASSEAGAGADAPVTGRWGGPACYDFDLAEFPLFSFGKRPPRDPFAPMTYSDRIRGKDGRPVTRSWTAYPGRLGVGGPTAHALLFDLLQLYAEQGGRGSRIHFGTLRSLFLRRGERNPSKKDYDRLRRDFAVLRGYDFSCKNAYWDPARRAYADMDWRLFGAVYYFKAGPGDADEQPHGFIELSPMFRAALLSRGLFRLGFDAAVFHRLPPLAGRLAVYLAKVFTYQMVHRRRVADLARALPTEAASAADARKVLARSARRLEADWAGLLADFSCEAGADGDWWAVFRRGTAAPRIPRRCGNGAAQVPGPLAAQVERIVEAVGGDDRAWWTHCVRRLGPGPIDRALGQLRETARSSPVRNPGGLLTKILKDIAAEAGILLRPDGDPAGGRLAAERWDFGKRDANPSCSTGSGRGRTGHPNRTATRV